MINKFLSVLRSVARRQCDECGEGVARGGVRGVARGEYNINCRVAIKTSRESPGKQNLLVT